MRITSTLLSIITCMVSLAVYPAATQNNNKKQPAQPKHQNIILDQSKDVYFEQNSPGTFSLQLLQSKSQFDHTDLIVGGLLELDWQHWQGDRIDLSPADTGTYRTGTGAYFTALTLDLMANVSRLTTLFFSISDTHIGRPGPDGNYIYLPHAFFLLGNVDKNPLYLTLGINSIPFGIFTGSGSWDTPLTTDYFYPEQAPQASLGYYKNGWNFIVTGYRDETNLQYHYVYTFSYNKDSGSVTYNLGAGYLTDLQTNTVGNPTINRSKRRRITTGTDMGGIVDFNASVTYGKVGLNGEYLRGSEKLEPNRDKPSAYVITATYTPTIAGTDTTFGLSHSRSLHFKDIPASLSGQDALLVASAGLKSGWAISATRSIITKFIFLGLDLEKDTTYVEKNTYTGTADLIVYL